MAEGQNYVEAINAARQRTRGSVRQRIDQIIDPLESAGAMDRMQGTSVMPTTGQVDPGVDGVISLAGGGGGAAPVRTAVGGGKAPITTTTGPVRQWLRGGGGGQSVVGGQKQSSGQCRRDANGNWVCPGSSSVVSQAPMASTTVSSPVVTSAAQSPAQTSTSVSAPMVPLDPAYHITQGLSYGDTAIAERAMDRSPVSGMNVLQADRSTRVGLELADIQQRDRELDEQKFVNREKAKVMEAETALTYAQADATNDTSSVGSFGNRARMAQRVFEGKANHNWYIDSVMRQLGAGAPFSDETKDRKRSVGERPANPAVEAAGGADKMRQELRREIFTGSVVYDLIRSNKGLQAIADTPGATLDIDTSREDGDPIMMRNSLSGIASSYAQNGALEQPFSEVRLNLMNDLRTLKGAVSTMFLDERRNNADYASLSNEQRAIEDQTALARGWEAATAIEQTIMDKMYEWHGQYKRGTFNADDPWKPKDRPNQYIGGWLPVFDFSPSDSNNTLPPPKAPKAPSEEAKAT